MTIKKVFQRYDETSKDDLGMPIELAQNNATICLFCLQRVWFNEWLYFNNNNGEPQKASYTKYWIIGDILPVIHGDECRAIWGYDDEYEYFKEQRIQLIKGRFKIPGVDKNKVQADIPYRPNEDQRTDRITEIAEYYAREKEKVKYKQTTLFQGANEL